MDPHRTAEKGRRIYRERLKSKLESEAMGQYIAIDVDSGNFVLGETPLDALCAAKQQYPGAVFHIMRVGAKSVFHLSSVPNREFNRTN